MLVLFLSCCIHRLICAYTIVCLFLCFMFVLVFGFVFGVWLGTPCQTWSIACRPALRSISAIFGFSIIAPHRRAALKSGN